jgi:hypothetical protein
MLLALKVELQQHILVLAVAEEELVTVVAAVVVAEW